MNNNGKKNYFIETILTGVFALCIIAVAILLYSFIPSDYYVEEPYTKTIEKAVPDNVHILTDEELAELYTCKPEERRTNDKILEFTYEDAQLLMHVARAEGGDTLNGQLYVMKTIVNRLYDDNFPDNIYDIVHQDNQFEVVTNGRYMTVELNANSHIALAMIEGGWDETEGTVYFRATKGSNNSWHERNLVFVKEVEGQRYYIGE